jgi:hypothetical protein
MRREKKRERTQRAPQIVADAARTSATIFLTLSALMFAASAAMAQTGADAPLPPSSASSAPANPAAAPQPQSAVGAFGNWVQQGNAWIQQGGELMRQGVTNMGAGFGQVVGAIGGQASRTTRDAAEAARNAAAGVSRLPNTLITAGSERCVIAPNGAPDCRVAAESLCRTKGYAGGTSVDFITVENCPPPWRTSRRNAPEGVCTTEHYVTKALCQ